MGLPQPDDMLLKIAAALNGGDIDDAVPLTGGTHGPVVRVWDTVRRKARSSAAAVHRLLRHLEQSGYDGAPRAVGFDGEGREVLSFIPGDVAVWTRGTPLPEYVRSEETLTTVARLMRRFHDATLNFVAPTDAPWDFQIGAPREGEVICHNDLGPWNTVFRNGRPRAFIDWDCAAPAPREWDVAYALYRFIPFQPDEICALTGWASSPDRRRRLLAFCEAYGIDPEAAVETIPARIEVMVDTGMALHAAGDPKYGEWWTTVMKARLHRDADFVRARDWLLDG